MEPKEKGKKGGKVALLDMDKPNNLIYVRLKSQDAVAWLYQMRGMTGQTIRFIIEEALKLAMSSPDFVIPQKFPWNEKKVEKFEAKATHLLALSEKARQKQKRANRSRKLSSDG